MDGEPCQLAVKGRKELPNKGWDVKAYMAAQKEKDKQIQLVFEKICSELKKLHSIPIVQGRNFPDRLVGAMTYLLSLHLRWWTGMMNPGQESGGKGSTHPREGVVMLTPYQISMLCWRRIPK